jgi:aspartokinase
MPNAQRVEKIDYRELRGLGIGGAGIIHPRALIHLSKSGAETWIMNTFNESSEPGTIVVPHREPDPGRTVLAISMRDDLRGFSTYFVGMDDEEGFSAACQGALKERGYHYEGSTGDTDSTTFYLGLPEDLEADEAVINAEAVIKEQSPNVQEVEARRYGAVHLIGREIVNKRNQVDERASRALRLADVQPIAGNADVSSPGSVRFFRYEDTVPAGEALYSEFFENNESA